MFILILLFVIIITFILSWAAHISANKDMKIPYGWGSFKDFLREYYKYKNWYTESVLKGSFFSKDSYTLNFEYSYYIHAGVIIFEGKCMNLYPWSYIMFLFWRNKEWKNRMGISKVIWH